MHPWPTQPAPKPCALFEEKLAKEPENSAWAAELADLLLWTQHDWTVLKPAEMKSEGGATLDAAQATSPILASGANPDRDVYSLVAKTDLKRSPRSAWRR